MTTPPDIKQQTDAIMDWHGREIQEATRRVMAAYSEAGARLRYLLLPLLHRWGMGMQRGGALMYHLPPGTDMDTDLLTSEHPFAVVMDKECDYHLWALAEPVADALWVGAEMVVGSMGTDILCEGETYLSDHLEDIPLPLLERREYLWVQIEPVEHDGLPYLFPCVPIDYEVPVEEGGGPFYLPGAVVYGPVTREYVDDIKGRDDYRDLVHVLPRYVVDDNGKFKREQHND